MNLAKGFRGNTCTYLKCEAKQAYELPRRLTPNSTRTGGQARNAVPAGISNTCHPGYQRSFRGIVPVWDAGQEEIPVYSQRMNSPSATSAKGSPPGLRAIGIFLFFGTGMASLAAATLLWPGTLLDRIWVLNPRAYRELAPLGKAVGLVFLFLAAALALAAAGWLKRRRWGWQLAVAIIGTQVLGDFVSIFYGRLVQGLIGVTIAGALLFYITQPYVRAAFAVNPKRIVGANNS